jgi:mycofactocin precursor peptide peptidase
VSDLGARTWPELDAATTLLALPVGSTEQHGPHLPLDTDARIAIALAHRLSAARADVTVAPALAYGSSGEHVGFPGTLSIGQDALELVLVELVRSALPEHGPGFRGVVLVHGHGGNAAPAARAVERLRAEGREVLSWWPRIPGGDLHAGRTETSLLMALAPEVVRWDAAVAGPTPSIDDLRRHGVRYLSTSGVLGDPSGASADEGHELLGMLDADLLAAVARRWP